VRAALAVGLLLGALLLPGAAHAQPVTSRHLVSGVLITRPGGAYLRYDYRVPVGPESVGLHVGVFDRFLVFSNEVGAQVLVQTAPPWLSLQLEGAVEPGFFRKLRPGDEALPVGSTDIPLSFGVRGSLRAQANVNLQLQSVWLYSRTQLGLRSRTSAEDDIFLKVRLPAGWRELGWEQASALMFRVAGAPPREKKPTLWAYGEHTIGQVVTLGGPFPSAQRPHRVSVGVIAERWPAQGVFLNLDLYYSLLEEPDLRGAGLILAAGWGF
jgi:hypothetical protein